MKTKTKTVHPARAAFEEMPKSYKSLCMEVFLPRPIHDKAAYEEALEAVEPFWGWEERMTHDQNDWFAMVTDVIGDYEDEHEPPFPESNPENVLRYLTEDACGWSGADLARFLGLHPTMGSKILRGERKLTVDHIRKLAKEFNVSADLLV